MRQVLIVVVVLAVLALATLAWPCGGRVGVGGVGDGPGGCFALTVAVLGLGTLGGRRHDLGHVEEGCDKVKSSRKRKLEAGGRWNGPGDVVCVLRAWSEMVVMCAFAGVAAGGRSISSWW